ncbi:DUF6496 domain-containing protein [Chryseosolibacter indicus]|uniref:Histone H1-like protein n=1 Tax=Chryseosolibacter indicus TaxID=2782351 RepID=A0ABS5VN04_9BACT|nr:DUF6496 domain-containing protein [Chryseosolibacter indicus]MBT1702840.1 hypothetical protein [Chryseosolibacter indicus]
MAKYSKSAGNSVKRAMAKKKSGSLKTGTGKKVTSRKQAIAIGLSEARKKGAKVPAKKGAAKKTAKKAAKKAPKKAAKKTAKKAAKKRSR